MFEIDGYGITLTRGDSFCFSVNLKGRVVANGCTAAFTVKNRVSDGEALIRKTALVENRRATFFIEPEETEGLKAKTYRWGLRVTDGDGNVYTPVADESFVITEVVE